MRQLNACCIRDVKSIKIKRERRCDAPRLRELVGCFDYAVRWSFGNIGRFTELWSVVGILAVWPEVTCDQVGVKFGVVANVLGAAENTNTEVVVSELYVLDLVR